jgi:hypothetical protein
MQEASLPVKVVGPVWLPMPNGVPGKSGIFEKVAGGC